MLSPGPTRRARRRRWQFPSSFLRRSSRNCRTRCRRSDAKFLGAAPAALRDCRVGSPLRSVGDARPYQLAAAGDRQIPQPYALRRGFFQIARRLDRRAVQLDDDVVLLNAQIGRDRILRDIRHDDALDDAFRVGLQRELLHHRGRQVHHLGALERRAAFDAYRVARRRLRRRGELQRRDQVLPRAQQGQRGDAAQRLDAEPEADPLGVVDRLPLDRYDDVAALHAGPGGWPPRRKPPPSASSTGCPSIAMTTSPRFRPASAAGEPAVRLTTNAPVGRSRPSDSAMSLEISWRFAPSHGRLTVAPPRRAATMTLLTMLTGIAKPIPMLPPERE